MPSGFSAQHFARGAPINDSSPSLSTTYSSTKIEQKIASAGGGSTTFLALTDTPASFSAGQTLRVNGAGTALEYYTPAGGVTINDATVSAASVYSSNKIDTTYVQQSKVKNAASTTAGDVYDVRHVDAQLATKANTTHTHVIGDVTNLQTSLDAKVNTSQVKNAASTTAGDVYDVRHVDAQLATKANTSHTHVINDVTNLQTSLDAKLNTSNIQTLAEGDSTSEGDVYSCNSVFSKAQIGTSVTSQEITVNNTTALGRLNFGSNLTSGLYGTLQTYANSTRYSAMHHYATSGNCNIDWYLMKANGLTKSITIFPNGGEKVFEVLTGGIKAPIFQQRDSTTVIKIGRMDSASYGVPGIAIIPLINTVNSEIQMRGLRNTGILGDSYVYHQSGSTLTIQSRFATNRHSSTHANIEVSTYQNGAETKVLDIGASSSSAKTLTITGTTHSTGHVTTDETTFNANNQLVTKQFVDTSIANLVNSAPSTLDTLNELASALGNDANFSTTVTNSIATKLPLAGGQVTGHVTTTQSSFTANDQLVSKQYVDTRLPTDVDTPITYNIQNAVADQNYVFGINGAANAMALVEYPKVYTGVPASSRAVRVGYEGGDYGSGMVSIGYEALADGTGSAGQTNAVRSVAVGYQAGYQSQAANHGIYIGPYQGYQLSTSNQLRIGNSGVSPTTAGYDKAIIEGTMATTDAGQTLRLNADTIYLGSALPTSQPADNRLWLSNGNLSIGAVSAGGGSTYLSLTDTPATHSANALLYSTGTAIAHTTTEILIDGGGVEVNQLNARVNNTSNIGDNSHRFNVVHCLAVQSTSGKLILPTSSGSVGQVLSIASLNGSDMTLGFSTVSGGGSSSATQVDPLTFGQSGGANTTHNGVTQSPDQHRTGITIGDRRFKWFVDDSFFAKSSLSKELANGVLNGYLRVYGLSSNPVGPGNYAYTGTADNETVFEENVLEGGHITFTPNNGVHYKFRGIRLNADSYATDFTQMSPAGTGLYNSCVANGADCRLAAFGLKDGVWKWLGTVSLNNTNAPSNGTIANPKDDTSMAEDPLTPSTTMRSEQMDFGSVKAPAIGITGSGSSQEVNGSIGAIGMLNWGTSSVKWPGFQPTPLLGVRRGQGTVYSGTYLWKFTHNIDFYQSYRIQHVKSGLTTTVNSVQYQRFNDNRPGQNGMTEVEFWAGVGT